VPETRCLEQDPGAKRTWDLIERARKGDESTVRDLRKMFQLPGIVDLVGGNLAAQARSILVGKAAGSDVALREALLRKSEEIQAELAGPNPSPLERLLADRAVACWLFLSYCECMMAQGLGLSLEAQEFHQRRVNHAHRRYLSALRTLAQVRKLALPVLQVNIARRQVNVAAASAADAGAAEALD